MVELGATGVSAGFFIKKGCAIELESWKSALEELVPIKCST